VISVEAVFKKAAELDTPKKDAFCEANCMELNTLEFILLALVTAELIWFVTYVFAVVIAAT
jgi:hypothetical protein